MGWDNRSSSFWPRSSDHFDHFGKHQSGIYMPQGPEFIRCDYPNPLPMSWVYQLLSIQAFSNGLGVMLIAMAVMIGLRRASALVAAIGSGAAVVMFLTTLSFLVSTPGWEASLGGFPALSVVPGQFLLKDVVLLGAALWSLGDALQEIKHLDQ
ncbi:hypothetical protein C2W62_23485 [Candidatus Entotheonella serta]|nr:hypothetical protein C2W62_23485 [Candidatus Entotheonella serta]